MSARPWLSQDERLALRAAIDKRRRELEADELPPQGNHGTDTAYRNGCRCRECLDLQTSRRKAYRQANREKENAYAREWRRRKREARAVVDQWKDARK